MAFDWYTSKKGVPTQERYFVYANGNSLNSRFREQAKVIDYGTLAWAPCVIVHNSLYYMFYGPSPTKLAVSYDFGDWFGQEIQLNGNPPMSCHRDHFVLKTEENKWLMYVSGMKDGKSSIVILRHRRRIAHGKKRICSEGDSSLAQNDRFVENHRGELCVKSMIVYNQCKMIVYRFTLFRKIYYTKTTRGQISPPAGIFNDRKG